MARKKESYGYEPQPAGDILALLARVPERLFVDMASRSGLTVREARELCDAFRRLKA